MIEDIVMPANPEAEKAVLGGILLNAECLPEAFAIVGPQDFSHDWHRRIYARMVELGEAGKTVDLVSLTNALTGEIRQVGGAEYISSLTDCVPRRSSIRQHAEIVRDKARRRELIHAMSRGISQATENSLSTEACIGAVQEALLSIEAAATAQPARHVVQFSDEIFSDLERMRNHQGELIGLSTGLDSLDLITTGLRQGEFWVLGGRPGEGKSSLALQALGANIRHEIPVALFSVEMSRQQVLTRLWSQWARIPFEKLRDPRRLNASEYDAVKAAMLEVGRLPLWVDDSGSLTIRQLVARARLLVRREKVRLIVVDYLQLVDAEGRDERQRISRISKALRELAKEGVPVLALSQLSRPKDGSLNTRPNKFSLKESGSLEADAHCVVLIYRPVDKQDRPTGEDELVVAKQRHGPWSIEPVYFDERTLCYRERQIVRRNS